jgi:hypothetical protein
MTKEEVEEKLHKMGREIQLAKEDLSKLKGREEQILAQLDTEFQIKDDSKLIEVIQTLIATVKKEEVELIEKYTEVSTQFEV